MLIQINDPKRLASAEFTEHIEQRIATVLARSEGRLTRVEVHLGDINAKKGGVDKRCLIEARPRGLDPVVAEHLDKGLREAFHGALDQLQRVLERQAGRLSSRD